MSTEIHTDVFLFEIETLFCTQPNCALHVRPGDPGVEGAGNWAKIDGITVGRRLVDGRMLCDFCAADTPPG